MNNYCHYYKAPLESEGIRTFCSEYKMATAVMIWSLLVLMLVGTASSSHFRGGVIMARPLPGGSQYEVHRGIK